MHRVKKSVSKFEPSSASMNDLQRRQPMKNRIRPCRARQKVDIYIPGRKFSSHLQKFRLFAGQVPPIG